jgi:hypothetical protein
MTAHTRAPRASQTSPYGDATLPTVFRATQHLEEASMTPSNVEASAKLTNSRPTIAYRRTVFTVAARHVRVYATAGRSSRRTRYSRQAPVARASMGSWPVERAP